MHQTANTSIQPPPTAEGEKTIETTPDDSSKLKAFLTILKRFFGESDIAAVRFSLPAQLLEPTPNLEYWNYLDRPETFISIGDSEEPLGRILGVLRFWFTKDLKYIKGKVCKPYNSALGEFFRCNWEIDDTLPLIESSAGSQKSGSTSGSKESCRPVKISYLTEQTSHHPPVSAFYVDCPEKGIVARGFDQLSAKFTGTSIRVVPGAHNLGIFITLQKWGEEQYQLTHPAAFLGGLLKGSLNVSVADSCYITCPNTRIKVIMHYISDGWLGRPNNKVEGVIFSYDPENDTTTKTKDVLKEHILGRIQGCWTDEICYTIGKEPFDCAEQKHVLIDLKPLEPVPKQVPPTSCQLPNESRRFWAEVTNAILEKKYSIATQLKQDLEEKQRQKAAERTASGEEWCPRFFTGVTTPAGKPVLTADGEKVLSGLHAGKFELDEILQVGG